MKKIIILNIAILILFFALTACSASTDNVEPVRRVLRVELISAGEEHERIANHHSFRDPSGATAGGGGGCLDRDTEYALEALIPMSLGTNPQIIIEGEQTREPRYCFFRRIDDEWIRVLRVNAGNPYEIFLTHGQAREEWEQVYAECFFDLLEPGEYKLYISVSWGNEKEGMMGQYFFKFTVNCPLDS